jgi:hypothetical protein
MFFDELCEDQRLKSLGKKFEVEIFNITLNRNINEMERRFQSFNDVSHFFKCLQPISLSELNDEELHKEAEILQKKYNHDISPDFVRQILSFRSCFKDIILKNSKITKEITEMLLIEHSPLTTTYPDVCTAAPAFILYLTLPITVAAAERSFSKLKIIKNYLRSTMAEERLSGLANISIENSRARQLNLEDVIDKFAQMKARKVNF